MAGDLRVPDLSLRDLEEFDARAQEWWARNEPYNPPTEGDCCCFLPNTKEFAEIAFRWAVEVLNKRNRHA